MQFADYRSPAAQLMVVSWVPIPIRISCSLHPNDALTKNAATIIANFLMDFIPLVLPV
jgi:hypothetical protein